MNSEKQLTKTFISSEIPAFADNADLEKIQEKFQGFQEFMMMYGCAIKEVRTKFEVLNDDFSVTYNYNPIEMIKSRVKSPMSIFGKIKRKGYEMNMDSVLGNINDVAGVRIICSFIDDIYKIAEMFTSQDDITVIEIKDYIKNPKPSGYRSYHMIIEIPVFFSNKKQNIQVEVQLRTIAMDFWASLEHTMKYKQKIENAEEIALELKECADLICEADMRMQDINNKINSEN